MDIDSFPYCLDNGECRGGEDRSTRAKLQNEVCGLVILADYEDGVQQFFCFDMKYCDHEGELTIMYEENEI